VGHWRWRPPARTRSVRAREGFGIGIGSGTGATGVSGKLKAGPGAFQGVLGFWGHGDSERARSRPVLAPRRRRAEPRLPVRDADAGEVGVLQPDWCFGLGGGVGVSTGGGTPGVAVAGIAGLEFNFIKAPLDVAIEYRPSVGILPGPYIALIGFTAHVRLWF
jgi:hypothetical protein